MPSKTNDYGRDDSQQTARAVVEQSQSANKPSVDTTQEKPVEKRRRLRVLADHPDLSPQAVTLLRQHRLNRAPDAHVEKHDEISAYYDYMAHLDPSHPQKEQPSHHLVPMPHGGLDKVTDILLPKPTVPDTEEGAATLRTHEQDRARLKNILYRMNTDSIRNEDRYRVGQLIRVPNEYIEE